MGSDDDLTRIEDLSDFLAAEDDDDDLGLDTFESNEQVSSEDSTLPNIDITGLNEDDEDEIEDEIEDDFNSTMTEDETGEFAIESSLDDHDEDKDEDTEPAFGEEESFFGNDDNGFGEATDSFGDNDSFLSEDNENSFSTEDDEEEESSFLGNYEDEGEDEAETDNELEENKDDLEEVTEEIIQEPVIETKVEQKVALKESIKEDSGPMKGVTIESHAVKQSEVNLNIEKQKIEVDLTSLSHIELKPISRAEFLEVKKFASNISFGEINTDANPPFSIILKDINNSDEGDEILSILKQHKIIKDNDEEKVKLSLQRGQLLIPRISEYSAIYLANKFRQYDVKISIALSSTLSEEIDNEDLGKVGSLNAIQNKSINVVLDSKDIDDIDIIITNKSEIDSYNIIQFKNLINSISTLSVEDAKNDETMSLIYNQLAKDLKKQAYNTGCNAIVNVMFSTQQVGSILKIICQGNSVICESNE